MQAETKIDDETALALMARIANDRDKSAFTSLFRYMAPKLKGFFLSGHPLTREIADELTQETMWKVWQRAGQYRPEKSVLNTWVFTIARNTRIDWLRQQHRHEALSLSADDLEAGQESGDLPFIALEERRSQQTARNLLQRLPENQMQIVQMIFIEGKSHAEIASELDMPLGTVKSRLRLALSKMKTMKPE